MADAVLQHDFRGLFELFDGQRDEGFRRDQPHGLEPGVVVTDAVELIQQVPLREDANEIPFEIPHEEGPDILFFHTTERVDERRLRVNGLNLAFELGLEGFCHDDARCLGDGSFNFQEIIENLRLGAVSFFSQSPQHRG